ncbi:PKD domain-containing protein [Motilimonas cestriensis]|uniref:PKD domain-containing protein n=1 Tax=Motilimonas cestriensis TaxID=2742685 RepID=A0ABS8W7F9_9GAMM|nr:PKD domain-containing protein [Motilimonas cestriensis]MCE2594493.1 PKD domain-containing protein [Motilimonas cestriensis]
MNLLHSKRITFRYIYFTGIFLLLTACGGGSTPSFTDGPKDPIIDEPKDPIIDEPKDPITDEPSNPIINKPTNQISHAYFLDQDGATGKISGTVTLQAPEVDESSPAKPESVWVYWADAQGNKFGEAWLKTNSNDIYQLEIPINTTIPKDISSLLLYPSNVIGQASEGTLVTFRDFTSNVLLSGMGGNEKSAWEYGIQRPKIPIQRLSNGLCIFDNGLVSVTHMNNTKENNYQSVNHYLQPKEPDDQAFPPFSFLCDEQPVHNSDHITDEVGVWTYSAINDAMFYGTVAYHAFVKYLNEPPWDEKVRLRVHYDDLYSNNAFWDGAYANFSDAYLQFYSTVSLDIVAHEISHGVLSRISPLNIFQEDISVDARTIHEAFGDISGVMAKYELTGNDNWIHGQETHGPVRQLNQIQTEPDAITSFLDYEKAGDNYYLRIGMLTYPFYLLSQEWGVEVAYNVYIHAAKNCWPTTVTLPQAAQCIKQQAGDLGLSEDTVITAFKTVKIKLFEEGVLSHFTAEQFKLRTQFYDNSQTTNQVTEWLWDFGDGHTSNEQNPEHTFAQPGNYQVTLTVRDQSNNQTHFQDSFVRTIAVTDQYCAIGSLETENSIAHVTINNLDINFDPNEANYTETPIILDGVQDLVIDIKGNNQSSSKAITWKVWIDLNDNGIFGDTNEELVIKEETENELSYQFQAQVDLSRLPNDNTPKYMRISGDYGAMTTPCQSNIGEALDLTINW